MIGVLSNKVEHHFVTEFFELFKTPWEFYQDGRHYDVLLVTRKRIPKVDASLVIIYGAGPSDWDRHHDVKIGALLENALVQNDTAEIPVYGKLCTFIAPGEPLLQLKNTSQTVGQIIYTPDTTYIRVGFNVFEEVKDLLTKGQPSENAHLPVLDIHISWLRSWIVKAKIPVVEIPPRPAGSNFFVCLTHDVDFIGIKQHKFDHTLWGFLYRALGVCSAKTLRRQMSLNRLWRNIKAVLCIPLIYLGLLKDFWNQFDAYAEIEKQFKATFFFIPFKKRPGQRACLTHWKRRAARYDIMDVRATVKKLADNGFEIGLHGIDSWHDRQSAREEFRRIADVIDQSKIGVRMHWLCFDQTSARILAESGFYYDSTLGYNDTVGYFNGTTQVFKLAGTTDLLELPLHIQDTALLGTGLTRQVEAKAWNLCHSLIKQASLYGGVLTLLWHLRSLAPERLFGDFYIDLLKKLNAQRTCFLPAAKIVEWFEFRRSVRFKGCFLDKDELQLALERKGPVRYPHLLLRVHVPQTSKFKKSTCGAQVIDVVLSDETEVRISLNTEQVLRSYSFDNERHLHGTAAKMSEDGYSYKNVN